MSTLPTATLLASNIGSRLSSLMTVRSVIMGVVAIVYIVASHFVAKTVAYVVSRVSNKKDTPESLKRSTAIHVMKSFMYWIIMCIAITILFVSIGIHSTEY